MKTLTVRGVIRRNIIELLEPVALPEGCSVEVDIHLPDDSLIGSMAAYDTLLEEVEREILEERAQRVW
jgi:predicted DNA-binding antitoxin AbrB/MazE fold protein